MRPLTLALLLVATTARAQDSQPRWMPAPPPTLAGGDERKAEARHLRRDGTIYTTVGVVLVTGGVALGVVALDVKQGDSSMTGVDGVVTDTKVYGAANWAELAGAIALMGGGLLFTIAGAQRLQQANALDSW